MKKMLGLWMLVVTSVASAESLESALDQLCADSRACAMKEIETLPPQFQAMAKGMVEQICPVIKASFTMAAQKPELKDSALACVKSLRDASCETMQTMEGTEACDRYGKALGEVATKLTEQEMGKMEAALSEMEQQLPPELRDELQRQIQDMQQ